MLMFDTLTIHGIMINFFAAFTDPPPPPSPIHGDWLIYLGRSIITTYLILLLLIAAYGLHRYWLVFLYFRHKTKLPRISNRFAKSDLPTVTVQLPMYNESRVAERVIDAACRIDYPADKLEIQVLDDSTPGSASQRIARERCDYWKAKGVDIVCVHRENRIGYKAGALDEGLTIAKGQFIAIFDADFVPPADFLRKSVHQFTDPNVGMVQARWSHLNRKRSILTRAQAMFLDGHFIIEHTARCRADRWFNFNGTAGLWRKTAIESAGGWQHDTLTEDVDLSYRAQLAGWRFVYLQHLACPAELPPEIAAFKSQQHRWNKGSIQTARKLLWPLLRSDASLGIKIESFFHLTSPMVYLYIMAITLLFLPMILLNLRVNGEHAWIGYLFGAGLLMTGTCSASLFYTVSQREQRYGFFRTILHLPAMMSIGIGIAVNNARGCVEALVGHESPFVRTPKYNADSAPGDLDPIDESPNNSILDTYTPSLKTLTIAAEIAIGFYTLYCAHLAAQHTSAAISVPFLLLFASGYLYVGLSSAANRVTRLWQTRSQPLDRLATQPSDRPTA